MKITTIKEYKRLINESIDFQLLNTQKLNSSSTYYSYNIIKDTNIVGQIELNLDNLSSKELEISYIEINKDYRNQSIGADTIKAIVKKFNPDILLACCVSKNSFYSFVKALGPPTTYNTVLKQLNSFKEVDDYLPNETNFNKDGIVIGGTDSGVFIRYDLL